MGIRRQLVRLIGATLAVAGLGVGCIALGYTPGINHFVQTAFRFIGWVLIIITLVAIGAAATLFIQEHSDNPLFSWYVGKLSNISIRNGQSGDIPRLVSLANTFIEGGASANFVDRLQARPETATIIEDHTKNGSIIGFYILLPLTASTTAEILNGTIRSGSQLTISNFTKSAKTAHSVYLGGLYGTDVRGRAITVLSLYLKVLNLMFEGRQLDYLFAKPSTKGSLNLRRRFPIKPIYNDDEIWQMSRRDAITNGLVEPSAIRMASKYASEEAKTPPAS